MGQGLTVALAGAEHASGLADMLQQYLQQTVDASPAKARAAARMHGSVVVGAAEDPDIAVRITFAGDRIDVADVRAGATPSITGDFLSVAHLVSGTESAGALLIRRRIAVRYRWAELPLLWRVSRLLRIEGGHASRRQTLIALVILAALALVMWWIRR